MSSPRPGTDVHPGGVLPAQLRLGPVQLMVADLERSIEWYRRSLGLRLQDRQNREAALGDGTQAAVVLHEDPQARPAGRHAGLYHYALLYPSREELARAARRLMETQTPVSGMSDHGTHEAIYLPDADGIGIELAADRPQDVWPSFEEEFSRGGPAPLDLNSLLATIDGQSPPAEVGQGLRVGHVHLHVGDVDRGLAFYRDVLGFDERANLGSAAFVSAGGYHHHLAFNTWRGEGVGPPPPHTVGLRDWTVELPTAEAVAEVRGRVEAAGAPVEPVEGGFRTRDPWEIAVDFVSA